MPIHQLSRGSLQQSIKGSHQQSSKENHQLLSSESHQQFQLPWIEKRANWQCLTSSKVPSTRAQLLIPSNPHMEVDTTSTQAKATITTSIKIMTTTTTIIIIIIMITDRIRAMTTITATTSSSHTSLSNPTKISSSPQLKMTVLNPKWISKHTLLPKRSKMTPCLRSQHQRPQ